MISRVSLHIGSQATRGGYLRWELDDAGGGEVWFYYAVTEGVRPEAGTWRVHRAKIYRIVAEVARASQRLYNDCGSVDVI